MKNFLFYKACFQSYSISLHVFRTNNINYFITPYVKRCKLNTSQGEYYRRNTRKKKRGVSFLSIFKFSHQLFCKIEIENSYCVGFKITVLNFLLLSQRLLVELAVRDIWPPTSLIQHKFSHFIILTQCLVDNYIFCLATLDKSSFFKLR